jgi:DNA mismatch repair protein MutS
MGAFVPAKKASWGVFSSIYSRIGAQDAISKGQSTFMVEMSELAHILNFSDKRSLLILDEIGRGTSTYDGMSVAAASLSFIHDKIKARTLCATHYHELTSLEKELPFLGNAHMAVDSEPELRFLYELKSGPMLESFGIEVARLAGLPKLVITEAWENLKKLENKYSLLKEKTNSSEFSQQPHDKTLDTHPIAHANELKNEELIKDLNQIDLNQTSPLEALLFLSEIKKKYTSNSLFPL